MSDSQNRLKLIILSGFLGSGKSTWLRHQLYAETFYKPHIIVNEVASQAVDDTLLHSAKALDVLQGGCVCCDLKSQMIELLHGICNKRTRKLSEDSGGILIFEMSGVADPSNVMFAINDDPILARHIVLEKIIVVVDGLHGIEQIKSEPLARSQIEAADQILISKAEDCSEQDLSRLVATLKYMNPNENITQSLFGVESSLPELKPAAPIMFSKREAADNLLPITSIHLNLDDLSLIADTWVGFSVWLSALLNLHGDQIVRIKGIVRTPNGRLLLQSVRKVMQNPERIPDELDNTLDIAENKVVLIGRNLDEIEISGSLKKVLNDI